MKKKVIKKAVQTLDEFKARFPNAQWLESRDGYSRWSNGEGPDTPMESAWFNNETEKLGANPDYF